MSGLKGAGSTIQLPNDWVPPRNWNHWDSAREVAGERPNDPLGVIRVPGDPLKVPVVISHVQHPHHAHIEQVGHIIADDWKSHNVVGTDLKTWTASNRFPVQRGSPIAVEDFSPSGLQAFSPVQPSPIDERFSGEMWRLIPKPSESEIASIDESVLTAMSRLSGKIWRDAREKLREHYGNAVWLSRVCERLMDPNVIRDKYVKRTMKKITDAMLIMVGPLINGVLVNSDIARCKTALDMLDVISPVSFAIHDSLLIGVFDMLDKAMRNPNLDVMCKASLAAMLGETHGEQRPDVRDRAANILYEAMATVHDDFVGLNDENAEHRAKLQNYNVQMVQLLGMYSRMADGARHLEGARVFFASLQQNARTESVKVAAGLFAGDSSVPSYNLFSSRFQIYST